MAESPASNNKPEGRPAFPVHYQAVELFQGTREVLIEHKGETYRLRITKSGKLILHK